VLAAKKTKGKKIEKKTYGFLNGKRTQAKEKPARL
jgi:hypothetical protein